MRFRAVINTVGTSLINNFKRFVPEKEVNFDNIRDFMRTRDEKEISAETNALSKLNDLDKDKDYLYFLCSDSEEGELCSNLLEDYYFKKGFVYRKVIRIKGLVKEFNKFQKVGLINLINELCDLIEEYDKKVVINATGGYKAEIAYATLVGILFKVRVIYIHEDFQGMIDMPFLPLGFDFNIWNEHIEEVEKILNSETKEEARKIIDKLPSEFEPLFQKGIFEEKYILSPAGEAIKRANKYFNKEKRFVPLIVKKSHSTLWGDSVKFISDIKDDAIKLILKRITRISGNIGAFYFRHLEKGKVYDEPHLEFINKRKRFLKYKIKTKSGCQYIDIKVDEGMEKDTLELLGKKIYP
ncbi:hypothetical protein DRQ09_07755 [candidate division KSB1 bacterium]|nr:MAG: hypothetical protein DRQ09_07755 [candidate division KSB1 bacterium]